MVSTSGRSVRVGFSRPRGKLLPLFSWAIRLYEWTPYSHTYFLFDSESGILCYQASGTSVNMVGQEKFDRSVTVIEEYEFDLSEEAWQKFKAFCFKNVGNDYSVFGVLGVVLADIFKLKKNPFDDGPLRQYCAELVTRCFIDMGFPIALDAERVRLKQVNEFVRLMASRRI